MKPVKVSMCREVIAFKYLGTTEQKVGRRSRTGLSEKEAGIGGKREQQARD